jgi:hypothetical protein
VLHRLALLLQSRPRFLPCDVQLLLIDVTCLVENVLAMPVTTLDRSATTYSSLQLSKIRIVSEGRHAHKANSVCDVHSSLA